MPIALGLLPFEKDVLSSCVYPARGQPRDDKRQQNLVPGNGSYYKLNILLETAEHIFSQTLLFLNRLSLPMKKFSPISTLVRTPEESFTFRSEQLCRVLKTPGNYICGMCGKQYNSVELAWNCVTQDTLKIKSLPIIAIGQNRSYIHCLLCGKKYVNAADAALCLGKDLETTNLPISLAERLKQLILISLHGQKESERDLLLTRQSSFGIGIPEHKETRKAENLPLLKNFTHKTEPLAEKAPANLERSLSENKPSEVQVQKKSIVEIPTPTVEKPITTIEDHNNFDTMTDIKEIPKIQSSPEPEPLPSPLNPGENNKIILTRKPGQKPFTRHEARYLCTVCKEKFFTKTEAEGHFLQHPLADSI